MSFWFRNKFPAIALCVVGFLDPLDKNDWPFEREVDFEFDVIVNGNQWLQEVPRYHWSEDYSYSYPLATKHRILLNLEPEYHFNEIEKPYFENEWNHAKISLVKWRGHHVNMKWMGFYVREQNTNMEDIQFINPAAPIIEEENVNVTWW